MVFPFLLRENENERLCLSALNSFKLFLKEFFLTARALTNSCFQLQSMQKIIYFS